MSLIFPSNPSIGDAYEGWTWNGTIWECAGGGGGDSGGPWFPLMGVTDGSNAAPGEVGEYLVSWTDVGNIPQSTQRTYSLALTAGDWDVSLTVTAATATAGRQLDIAGYVGAHEIYLTGMNEDALVSPFSGRWTNPPRRVTTAASATVSVDLSTFNSGGPFTVYSVQITARRMR